MTPEEVLAVAPVSYTHLDVYKRQQEVNRSTRACDVTVKANAEAEDNFSHDPAL